jgi:calcium/calmodulin-dependent protein kinase I
MQSISGKIYKEGRKLGAGTFGTVYAVVRDDGKEFAFKKFERESVDLDLGVLRELSILKIFQGTERGVMNLEDIIVLDDDEQTVGIIMKKYGSDLHDAIRKKTLDKKDRRRIARKLLESVVFLHENGVIHRDIKPENVLLDENKNPILADYTLAKVFHGVCTHGTHTGKIATATYRAPEVVAKKPYGFPADAWSLGVVFYELFTGQQLRAHRDKEALEFLFQQVSKFKDTPLGHTVRGLLAIDPKERWTARQALEGKMFGVVDFSVPKVWETIRKCRVSKSIKELCEDFETEKKVTRWAAQTYMERTGCSAHSAIELACKFYETEIFDIESEEYPEEEMLILQKMDYNLFI